LGQGMSEFRSLFRRPLRSPSSEHISTGTGTDFPTIRSGSVIILSFYTTLGTSRSAYTYDNLSTHNKRTCIHPNYELSWKVMRSPTEAQAKTQARLHGANG
jgi:hypothetical protein